MKHVRYLHAGKESYGILEGNTIHEVEGCIFCGAEKTGRTVSLAEAKLLSPVKNPGKIVAIGLNYKAHAAESNHDLPTEPLIFMKAPTAIIGPGDAIELPTDDHRTDEEAELVIVIGKKCRKVSREHALEYVFGYTCGNDVSDRVLQRKDGQWVRAKSFDTFCPLGPWIETGIKDPGILSIQGAINGDVKQKANTSDLIFSVPVLVEAVSACMTLLPGDIIMSGTPAGVSPLHHGDSVDITIEGIGTLTNPVVYKE